MSKQEDFFTPEEVDRQIDEVSRFNKGERTDAEVLAYLHSLYGIDRQQERAALDRIWKRVADAVPASQYNLRQNHEREIAMQKQPAQVGNVARPKRYTRHAALWQRLGTLAAVVFLVALVGSMALIFYTIRHNAGGPGTGGHNPTVTIPTVLPKKTTTPTVVPVSFKVTAVDMAVEPASIAGIACGTHETVTYKATLHVAAQGPGGVAQFSYTTNNGRGQSMASVTFAPGQTSQTYAFTWSGALPADHTSPGLGGIQVSSPNQFISPTVKPNGTCS